MVPHEEENVGGKLNIHGNSIQYDETDARYNTSSILGHKRNIESKYNM